MCSPLKDEAQIPQNQDSSRGREQGFRFAARSKRAQASRKKQKVPERTERSVKRKIGFQMRQGRASLGSTQSRRGMPQSS